MTSNTVVEAAINGGVAVHRVGSPVFSENLAVAFDKNSELPNDTLVARVGEIIQEVHADGTLRELSLKWFGSDLSADPHSNVKRLATGGSGEVPTHPSC